MSRTNTDLLDSSEASGADVRRRLDTDIVGWFVTTRVGGRPHAVPVWFLWRGDRALIMSEPKTVKVANVRRSPHALLHLHTDETGNGVVVLTGTATISDRPSTQWLDEIGADYTAKYAEGMKSFGMGLEAIAQQFSTVIEFRPESLTAC